MICFFPPIYFSLFNNNNNKTKQKRNKFMTIIFTFQPSGHFSSAAFTLQDSAEKRTIPTHGSVEKWASAQKWSYGDGRAALCAHPGPNKSNRSRGWWSIQPSYFDNAVRFIHQPAIKQWSIKRCNSSETIFISSLNLAVVVVMCNHSFTCTKEGLLNWSLPIWIHNQCRAVVTCGIFFWPDLWVDWLDAMCCF